MKDERNMVEVTYMMPRVRRGISKKTYEARKAESDAAWRRVQAELAHPKETLPEPEVPMHELEYQLAQLRYQLSLTTTKPEYLSLIHRKQTVERLIRIAETKNNPNLNPSLNK